MRLFFFFLFIGISFIGFSQEKNISGVVLDENNLPLPGATVIVKGTTNGVSTDFDGLYNIHVTKGAIIEYSYVGYKTQTFEVRELSIIDVALEVDVEVYHGCYFPSIEDIETTKNDKKPYTTTILKWNGVSFNVVR